MTHLPDSPFDPTHHEDTVLAGGPIRAADRPASQLVLRLIADLDPITDEVVDKIRARLDPYGAAGAVPRTDLWWSVRSNLEMLMRSIAEDRTLTEAEIAVRRTLGQRRARQAMAVSHLIQAFQIGYLEVWRMLSDAAVDEGPEVVTDVLDMAGPFWAMMHEVSSAVAEAHHAVAREQVSEVRRRAVSFLDLLRDLPEETQAARDEARALGLDPDATVIAAVRHPRTGDDPLEYRDRGMVLVERQASVVLIGPAREDAFADEVGQIGIGMARPGLQGAHDSFRDALMAFDAARALGRERVRYDRDWFVCIVATELHRLGPLAQAAAVVIGEDPQVRETLEAYLQADGKLTGAGQAIHVHPNTIGYRLERFAERTGIDPRTSEGLLRCRLALVLDEAARSARGRVDR